MTFKNIFCHIFYPLFNQFLNYSFVLKMFFQNLSRLILLHALLLLLKFLFDEILFDHLLSFQDFESFSFADGFLLVDFDSYFFISIDVLVLLTLNRKKNKNLYLQLKRFFDFPPEF